MSLTGLVPWAGDTSACCGELLWPLPGGLYSPQASELQDEVAHRMSTLSPLLAAPSRLLLSPPCPGWGAPQASGEVPASAVEREAFQISAQDAGTHFTFIESFL